MTEFEDIGHSGGKITIHRDGGKGFSMGVSGCQPHAMSIFQLGASFEGEPLFYIPLTGLHINPGISAQKVDYIPVIVISDKEGFYGWSCPKCSKYFRSSAASHEGYCCYCEHKDKRIAFLTSNQKNYIKAIVEKVNEAIEGTEDISINLDEIVDNLGNNRSPFVYPEERQQKRVTCKECNSKHDILGEYGSCHYCGIRNSRNVLEEKFNEIEQNLNKFSDYRQIENCLEDAVSDFDGYGSDIKRLWEQNFNGKELKRIKKLSFQRVSEAKSEILDIVKIDIFDALSPKEIDELCKLFQKRHLITHCSGIVDQKYLYETGEALKLGQRVKVTKDEVRALLHSLRRVASNIY